MEKRIMTLLAMLFLIVGGVFSQTKVNGTVVSQDDGQPVIGATVQVVGTQTGTVTNADGRFALTVPAGKSTLRITYVGMEPLEVSARPNMRIVLTSDQTALDEVIVVAYGTQKKSAFTGSAAVVGSEDIGKVQVTNAVDALKGKAAGVQINTATGQPGATPTIRIRGVNSINADSDPLIVLDGSPYDGSLNDINPADVESMTVLKDAASTALYGARGGNGVILITTKSGKRGQDATVTLDAKWGVNTKATPEYLKIDSPAAYYEMWYKGLANYAMDKGGYSALEAWQYANEKMVAGDGKSYDLGYNVYSVPQGQYLIGQNGKLNPNATLGRIISYKGEDFLITPDDWVDETYHSALRQEYTLSTTASTDRSTFYGSVNYLSNEGITEASDYSRLTARLKADYQVKPWLKFTGNMSYGHYERNYLGDDGDAGSSGNAFALTNMAPIYPIYVRNADGSIRYNEQARINNYDYGDGSIIGLKRAYLPQANPLSSNQLDTNQREGNTFNGTGQADITLPYGFTFTSINNVYLHEFRYTSTTNPFFGQYASTKGQVSKENLRDWSYNYQQRLNWRKLYGQHSIEAMLGHEYYRLREYELRYYMNNQFSVFNKELAGTVVPGSGSSYTTDYNTESWLGRVHYNFDERYFLQGSIMREASSHFAKDNRWGTFWSVGGGWLVNKESFFNVDWVDELKLKASYGENGNDLIGSYQYITYYNIENSNNSVSLVPASLGNHNISWEKNAKFNIGVDFSLLKNRIWGSVEYYAHKTNDMLSWVPLPESFGFTGYYDNVGNMVNNGVEIDLHGELIRSKDFSWTAYVNLTSNHNEITKLAAERKKTWYDNLQGYGYSSGSFFFKEGESRYTYYTKQYAGVDPTDGQALYWANTYEQRQSKDESGNLLWKMTTDADGNAVKELDANGNPIAVLETVYYDSNWNVIEDPDHYVGEKRRKVNGREKTTDYSAADYYLCGDVLPDVYGGFGTAVSYKGFDFSVDFQYQLGGQIYDGSYASLMGLSAGRAMHADLEKAWTKEQPNTDVPRLQFNDTYMAAGSDRFLTSASYLSLQNITLGYTLPRSLVQSFGVQKIRLYVVGDNLWTWTKRQGLDSRQSITGDASSAYYSSIRTISGGITLTF